MVTLKVTVRTEGKIFGNNSRQIALITKGAIMDLLQFGESRLDVILRPRPAGVYLSVSEARRGQASTGHFRRSVHSIQNERNARIQSNVIYGPWLEGDSSRNFTTRFKGYGSFRKVAQEMEKKANPVLTAHVNRFVRSID